MRSAGTATWNGGRHQRSRAGRGWDGSQALGLGRASGTPRRGSRLGNYQGYWHAIMAGAGEGVGAGTEQGASEEKLRELFANEQRGRGGARRGEQ